MPARSQFHVEQDTHSLNAASKPLLALISFVLLASLCENLESASEPSHWRAPNSCGVASSYVLLRLKNVNCSYDDLANRIPIKESGSSVVEMQKACAELGLSTSVLKVSPKMLDGLHTPMIFHLRPAPEHDYGHYVVVTRISKNKVWLVDTNIASNVAVEKSDLFRQWTGIVLIPDQHISPNKKWWTFTCFAIGAIALFLAQKAKILKGLTCLLLFSSIGCDIAGDSRISETHSNELSIEPSHLNHELGLLRKGESTSAVFEITNRSNVAVNGLTTGVSSCKCTKIEISHTTIPPGSSANLIMHISNRGESPGPFSAFVTAESINPKWSSTFSVHGCNEGMLPMPINEVWRGMQIAPHTLHTTVYAMHQAVVTASANLLGTDSEHFEVQDVSVNVQRSLNRHQEVLVSVRVLPIIIETSDLMAKCATLTARITVDQHSTSFNGDLAWFPK